MRYKVAHINELPLILKMKTTLEIGNFKIYLPDENSKQFYIFCDLAELFSDEYQSDSVSKLKKDINESDLNLQ